MKHFLPHLSGVVVCWAQSLFLLVSAGAAAAGGPLPTAVADASNRSVATVADSLTTTAHAVVLKGTVLLHTGQPCAGASVYVAGAPRQLVITDAQGVFTMPVSASAAVVLYVDYFGEGTSRVKVLLPLTNPLRITLGQ